MQKSPGNSNLIARDALVNSLSNAIKFSYGYLFGAFMWYALVSPYTKFYDFERPSYLPEFVFCLGMAFLYLSFRSARAIMTLFVPNFIGLIAQNHIIILLFIALFTEPVTNVSLNAIETSRVIGCSLMMTFDKLNERANLILNPVVEVFNDRRRGDLITVEKDLTKIQDLVMFMREEAEFERKFDRIEESNRSPVVVEVPSVHDIEQDLSKRMIIEPNKTMELAEIARKLVQNATINFNSLSLNVSLDIQKLRKFARLRDDSQFGEFNFSNIIYDNCLGVFKKTKASCQGAVDIMESECKTLLGSFLGLIFCSPVYFSLGSACPWIMSQLIDEASLCDRLQDSISDLKIDPFHITGGADINDVFKNLNQQFKEMRYDLLDPASIRTERLELHVSLNNQTKSLLLGTFRMVEYIREKFSLKQLFLDIALLCYELYTSFSFLCIMIQAYSYHSNYLTNIRYDNHYITRYFSILDNKRKALGKPTILPLTKLESEDYVKPFSCRKRCREEKDYQRSSCFCSGLFLLFTLTVIYLDDIFSSILKSVSSHAIIEYNEIGHNIINVKVYGEGSIARLVRRLTDRLNSVYYVDLVTSTQKCLPRPSITSNKFYFKFAYLLFIYVFIDQIIIFAMRLRRVTAAFFYPDHERHRIIYLYRTILIRRQGMKNTGLNPFTNAEDNEADEEELVFTLKEALNYLGECVQESIRCSRCCSGSRSKHQDRALLGR